MATYKSWAVNELIKSADLTQNMQDSKDKDGKFFGALLSSFGYNNDVIDLVVASHIDNTGQVAGPAAQVWGSIGSGGTPYLSITPVTNNMLVAFGTAKVKRSSGTGWCDLRLTRVSGTGGTAHLLTGGEMRINDADEKYPFFVLAIEGPDASEQRIQFQVRVQNGPTDQLQVVNIRMLGFAI